MRRLAASTVMGLLALLLCALPAAAGLEWCYRDPIVRLNGTQVQILVAVPEEYQALVNGPVNVEITTPTGTTREVVFTDAGFNGHGETVIFYDGGTSRGAAFSVGIRVTVPLSQQKAIPVQVTVIPENAKGVVVTGTSDGVRAALWITGQ